MIIPRRWLPSMLCSLLLGAVTLPAMADGAATATDPAAETMLLLQTASGGWSKHLAGRAVDYDRPLTAAERDVLGAPDRRDDATIDNDATTREIRHLAVAWQSTRNPTYLAAARRGVDYLLAAQYANGGWPQFHPDHSGYRGQVTFNDDAMTQVVGLLQDLVEGRGALAALTPDHGDRAAAAVARALDLILALQVEIDGLPTIWAAQYDETTLLPAKARSYELPSLASAESVAIVRLLMRQPAPTPQIVAAIDASAAWFEAHRLSGLAIERTDAAGQRDVRLVPAPGASLWARFYDLEHQQPLVVDRDGGVVAALADLSDDRRNGYAWYGVWPEQLLQKDLPRWRTTHAAAISRADTAH